MIQGSNPFYSHITRAKLDIYILITGACQACCTPSFAAFLSPVINRLKFWVLLKKHIPFYNANYSKNSFLTTISTMTRASKFVLSHVAMRGITRITQAENNREATLNYC